MPLAGRPMVEWSVAAFRGAGVAAIVVAVPPGHGYEPAGDVSAGDASVQVLAGGETRSASVSNALEAVDTDLVAIHDAARPLVASELIDSVVAALIADGEAAGAIAAIPVTDTVKRVEALVVGETLDRAELWAAQTPQVFRTDALRAALRGDPERVAAATDEAMLIEAAGGRVLIHPTQAENLKVTTPLDLRLAEQLLAARADA